MVFIYLIEKTEPYFTTCRHLLSLAESGQIIALSSIISVLETLSPSKYIPAEYTQTEIVNFFKSTPGVSICPVDWPICLEAARLRRENKFLKTPDSIQLATAIANHADFFITHDTRLQKLRLPNLKIISLDRHGRAVK
ncbi:MAG: hypothetical protein UX80_C0012G0010 [Candidatus Amesbacteria bacterium GW2011_GWA2_47_11b]|nr:MAG: hypothetical protein UX42_C0010G0010 [Microgenomates group bacterium GW2011_GWC1_46_20]KKU57603.1 MAG: hypothetical protein UX80_C0012G0010 [Candidatus Amesbacteria bacterium GW2011_GWA2_47_11b]